MQSKGLRELGDLGVKQLQEKGNHPGQGTATPARKREKEQNDMRRKNLDFGRVNFSFLQEEEGFGWMFKASAPRQSESIVAGQRRQFRWVNPTLQSQAGGDLRWLGLGDTV